MASDDRDAAESPELEEDGSAGAGVVGDGGESDSDMHEPDVADEDDEDLNSPSKDTVTVALPAGASVPVAAIPVDSDPKWHRTIIHLRPPPPPPPTDDSRRLFQRLWTDEDEIELLRGFLDYITSHRGNNSSHPPDTAPFYEQIKSKLQLEFNKNQLVEKLRRLKKKYRNVMSKIGSGKEVFFKSSHDQATFDISRKIWNQTGKIIGFEDNSAMDLEEPNTNGNANVDIDCENLLEKKVTVSRKRSRSRIGKIDEDKPIALSDGPIPSGATSENVAAFGEFSDGRSLEGLIEETVKSCVSPLIKEMMNGTTGMMMAAVGGYPGGGVHAMGVLSPMLMPSVNLGFGGGGGKGGVGDERWRRQQILELEVYSRRLELVQEQIRATVNELKTMPSGG